VAEQPSSVDAVARAVDGAPFRPLHLWLFLAATGGTLLDGMSVFMTGLAVPLLRDEFAIPPAEVGLLGSALVLGAVAGAVLGGHLSDRLGRKDVFLGDMALLAVAALALVLAPSVWWVLAGQFLLGVAVGMDFPTASAYVAETMPAAERQKMVVGTITFQAVGLVAAAGLGLWLIPAAGSDAAWRWLFGSLAVMAVLFFLLRLMVPESPHWLAAHGHPAAAARVVARLRPAGVGMTAAPVPDAGAATGAPATAPRGFGVLFAPAFLRLTSLTAGAWFLMDFATYGVGIFTPVILQSLDPAAGADSTLVARELHVDRASGLVDLFLLLGFLMGIWLVPRVGAVRMQVAGFVGMAAGMLLLAWASGLPAAESARPELVILGFVLFNLAMNAGPNSTTFLLPALLFPTTLRGTAAGFAAACAKVGATLGTFLLPELRASFGTSAMLLVLAGVSIAGCLVTVLLRPREPASAAVPLRR
jgi:MFS transporter, putative metabolite transport protein